jgi:hypothetical protein
MALRSVHTPLLFSYLPTYSRTTYSVDPADPSVLHLEVTAPRNMHCLYAPVDLRPRQVRLRGSGLGVGAYACRLPLTQLFALCGHGPCMYPLVLADPGGQGQETPSARWAGAGRESAGAADVSPESSPRAPASPTDSIDSWRGQGAQSRPRACRPTALTPHPWPHLRLATRACERSNSRAGATLRDSGLCMGARAARRPARAASLARTRPRTGPPASARRPHAALINLPRCATWVPGCECYGVR